MNIKTRIEDDLMMTMRVEFNECWYEYDKTWGGIVEGMLKIHFGSSFSFKNI